MAASAVSSIVALEPPTTPSRCEAMSGRSEVAPVRRYKVDGDENMGYSHSFSRVEMTRLVVVMNAAIACVDGGDR